MRHDAVIIGGGIIGLSIAYRLACNGYSVAVIDERDREKASYANAGYVSPSLGPISLPRGGFTDVIKWCMLNGTVRMDKGFLLRNMRWLKGFRVNMSNAKTREMALYAIPWYERLAGLIEFNYKMNGLLEVYRSHKGLEHRLEHIRGICSELNIRYEVLDKKQVKEFEPRLKRAEYAIYYPEDAVLNPLMLMNNLKGLLSSMKIRFFNSIKHVEYSYSNSKIRIAYINSDGMDLHAEHYILCTGACKAPLKDVTLPVVAARGYALDISLDTQILDHPVLLGEHRVALAQLNSNTLRASGFFELTSIGSKVRESNFSFLYRYISEYIELGSNNIIERWVGYRPCTQDSMPIVCRYPRYSNLIVVVGHCRLGITLTPYTAELVYSIIYDN